ncbi:SGNH hydrolase [Lizonia empirigonia]|nr:SGNH hydrolase [Lizonia empirigonia]
MRFTLLSLLPAALALPAALQSRADKPVFWLLAGDSTTAPNGGWGDAFLSTTVAKGSSGTNHGHGGATTASFRAAGYWAKVISDIATHKSDYRVYVTIQFGHNDQKPTSGVSLSAYKTNLASFASEAATAGATPILVTPLTRRGFSGGKVVENLANETAATIQVATANGRHYIDLNRASTAYVNAIGAAAADAYNLAQGDRTHLNKWGGVVFSRIVSDLLVDKYPAELEGVTVKNQTLSALIEKGVPA